MSYIEHFLYYLEHHPAIKDIHQPRIMLGFTESYAPLTQKILTYSNEHYKKFTLITCHLESDSLETLSAVISNQCDIFILFYDSSTLIPPSVKGPDFIHKINPVIKKYWKKSTLFKDYKNHFEKAFSISPSRIEALNSKLINAAQSSETFTFKDDKGSVLSDHLVSSQRWTNINGCGNFDIVPGEIARHPHRLSGKVAFTGTFLSTIPFSIKYGIIHDPLFLTIDNNEITAVETSNASLKKDFEHYLAANPSNMKVEELGIGTNEGVTKLYGINAGFEERHCGLHLGLGGGAVGSHHLDLIFDSGRIYFDEQKVFDGTFF